MGCCCSRGASSKTMIAMMLILLVHHFIWDVELLLYDIASDHFDNSVDVDDTIGYWRC